MTLSIARRCSGASSAAPAGRNGTEARATYQTINDAIGVRLNMAGGSSTQKGIDRWQALGAQRAGDAQPSMISGTRTIRRGRSSLQVEKSARRMGIGGRRNARGTYVGGYREGSLCVRLQCHALRGQRWDGAAGGGHTARSQPATLHVAVA